MKGKRLGRGLEEVSHVFLSSESAHVMAESPCQKNEPETPVKKNLFYPIHTIGISGSPQSKMDLFTLCNTSIELARQGYRVLVIDHDPEELNVTRLMGMMDIAGHTETNFISGPMGIRIAYRTSFLNDLLKDPTFMTKDPSFWPEQYQHFDFILFHLPFGQLKEMGPLLRRLSLSVFLTSSSRESMLETYKAIKDLHQRARQIQTGLTVCSEKGETNAAETFYRMARNVKTFLDRELVSYSYLQTGEEVNESIEDEIPLVLKSPSSKIRRDIYNISALFIEDHIQKGRSRSGH